MKLAFYRKHGQTCFGAVTPQGLVTLNGKLGAGIDSLGGLLAHGSIAEAAKIEHHPTSLIHQIG